MGTRLGIIGVGEIAAAIVDGLCTQAAEESPPADAPAIVLSPRGAAHSARLAETYPHVEVAASNQEVIDRSDRVLLAVLPQQVEEVLTELDVPEETTLVSAVAGVSVAALETLLPHRPDVVRVIPLPAVRERRGLTAVHPGNAPVEALFDRLGGTVVAETEAMFSTLSATTATMSAHFAYLLTITEWLIAQGWARTDAEAVVRGQFVGLGTTLADTDTPIADLVAAHETPGGINAQVRSEWMDEDNRQHLSAALDAVLARVTGAPQT
ncbi:MULTISPECIES: NAD(P)-binding domain-containing protein [unclassified Brevibacterium]|uniref:NAD(P)-binding domain-containing protein n=1 Tax=unclassified Brevibacterium TaxID=2614124 RepID=UPI0010F867C7|nr:MULTISPECIES: NAD(P)-binding domain-containing protein [unclassified Brevibacterium]MCM1011593.1 NAD(P)-binding domain-containing protein [Brevibacterium sp. XM4083]